MHALALLCIKRPVFATMLILSLVVVGTFCYFSLGVDLFPKVDIPTVQVAIADPGASPEEIETEITKKVEDSVNTISQIDQIISVSSEGQSLATITFELSKNGDVAAQEVQNKINTIVNDLPRKQHVRRVGSLNASDLEPGIGEFLVGVTPSQAGRAASASIRPA